MKRDLIISLSVVITFLIGLAILIPLLIVSDMSDKKRGSSTNSPSNSQKLLMGSSGSNGSVLMGSGGISPSTAAGMVSSPQWLRDPTNGRPLFDPMLMAVVFDETSGGVIETYGMDFMKELICISSQRLAQYISNRGYTPGSSGGPIDISAANTAYNLIFNNGDCDLNVESFKKNAEDYNRNVVMLSSFTMVYSSPLQINYFPTILQTNDLIKQKLGLTLTLRQGVQLVADKDVGEFCDDIIKLLNQYIRERTSVRASFFNNSFIGQDIVRVVELRDMLSEYRCPTGEPIPPAPSPYPPGPPPHPAPQPPPPPPPPPQPDPTWLATVVLATLDLAGVSS